ncbi:hypothetical protein [Streptomyces sp. NPDC088789]|uniref:hypothetical protein n=1 Tax=Streptomyces sp. NPDC088789 TaxID=3365899 RepID=UPI00381F7D93
MLTDAQVRGAVCVWDATEPPLTAETAVDLGERLEEVHWFPRACRGHTGDQAHRALLDHVPACEECTERKAMCGIGSALYRLATRRAVSGALDLGAMRDAARERRQERRVRRTQSGIRSSGTRPRVSSPPPRARRGRSRRAAPALGARTAHTGP